MFESLDRLNVGDIAALETEMRDRRRRELISTFKELYGDNMPSDAVFLIDRELGKLQSLLDGDEVDIATVQFLLWRSIRKKQPEITLEEVGESMDIGKLEEYVDQLMPAPQDIGSEKKT